MAARSPKPTRSSKAATPRSSTPKTAVAAAPMPAKSVKPDAKVKTAAAPEPAPMPKPAKMRLVRDSFTMPESDHALIGALKKRLLTQQRPTKKSELLRAGLKALAAMTDVQLKTSVESLAPIKTGRPKKH